MSEIENENNSGGANAQCEKPKCSSSTASTTQTRYMTDEAFRNRIKANMKKYYDRRLKGNEEYLEKKRLAAQIKSKTLKLEKLMAATKRDPHE